MEKKDFKGWLYLLPALLFLGAFLVYPLIDVFVYSFEEAITPLPRLTMARESTTIPMCSMSTFSRL